jgi:hypothetical protein
LKAAPHRDRWLPLIGLLIITAILYFPGLYGGFFFDDRPSITDNPSLQLYDGSFSSLIAAAGNGITSPLGRPVSMASFALNLHFFGAAPFSFKLVNLLIHLANGVLVFALARRLLPRLVGDGRSSLAAIWVAAVWLLHPINLPPVLFAVQRMTSLSALFMLMALNLYLHGRQISGRKGWLAIAAAILVCWPLAVFSKETTLLLPLLILVCEWLALDSLRSMPRRRLLLAALVTVLAGVCVLAASWHFIMSGYRFRDFGMAERVLTEARVLWFYAIQLLLPWPDLFSLYHDDFPISRGLLAPLQTLLAIVGWVALAALAIYRRRQWRWLPFAVFWFLAAHAIESTILPLEIAYEHRNYLASFGMLIGLAGLLFTAATNRRGKLALSVLAIALVVFCGFVTALRAHQWGDEYRRAIAEAAAHPNSPRANHDAAFAVVERTFLSPRGGSDLAYQTAQSYLKQTVALDRRNKSALLALLYLDCLAGKPKNVEFQTMLRDRFATIPFAPGDRGIIQGLSELLVEKRLCLDDAETDRLLQAALSNPHAVGAVRSMLYAVAMDYAVAKMKSLPLATEYARAAVQSDPGSVPMRINLVRLLIAMGDRTAARREYAILAGLPIQPLDRKTVRQLGSQLEFTERDKHGN